MRGRAFLQRYFTSQIEERRRSARTDMFSQLCRAEDDNGDRLSDEEIAQHMIFLVLAAHDTTASAITTSTWALGAHVDWQDRLRDEIRAHQHDALQYEARDSLIEMDWVFKEAIRMQPPVAFMMRRTVREVQLGPYRLPKNLTLTPVSLITHYLPNWWTHPGRFDPLRFSPERAEHKQHTSPYYPFGGGAHRCLDVHLATMQAKAVLYQFLRRYTVTLNGHQPTRFQAVPIPHPADSLPVTLDHAPSSQSR